MGISARLSCIKNNRIEQAQAYIQEICTEIEAKKVVAFCENEAANLILSAFCGRAESQGIAFCIKATLPQNIPISESDWCILLSNALENALHACLNLKKKGMGASIDISAYEKKRKNIFTDCQFLRGNHILLPWSSSYSRSWTRNRCAKYLHHHRRLRWYVLVLSGKPSVHFTPIPLRQAFLLLWAFQYYFRSIHDFALILCDDSCMVY